MAELSAFRSNQGRNGLRGHMLRAATDSDAAATVLSVDGTGANCQRAVSEIRMESNVQ